jgi:hypothetical protein
LVADYLIGASPESLLRQVESSQQLNNKWMWYWACGDAAGVIQNTAPEEMNMSNEGIFVRRCLDAWANALAYKITGDEETARNILINLRDRALAQPNFRISQSAVLGRLGMVHALLGDQDASMAVFDQLRKSAAENSQDANWMDIEVDRAVALAWLGRKDEAVAELDRLIKEPTMLNVHLMRECLDFWPLRDHPGFQAILNDPANNRQLPDEKL